MPVSDDRAATPPDGKIAVDLRQVVYALSDALDLVGIDADATA